MINSLMSKNQYLENENNNIIENNDIERDSKFNLLLNDNEKLFQENLNLKNILNILNEKMRQIHIFLKKKEIAYENKIDEYKEKIVVLKKRINELCTRNGCCYKNDYNKRKNKSINFSKADNYLLTETSYNYNLDNNPNLGYQSMSFFYPRKTINKNGSFLNLKKKNNYNELHLNEKKIYPKVKI